MDVSYGNENKKKTYWGEGFLFFPQKKNPNGGEKALRRSPSITRKRPCPNLPAF